MNKPLGDGRMEYYRNKPPLRRWKNGVLQK